MTRGDGVTVVGAGAMGGGLATHFALCDRPVTLVDHRESNLEDARRRIEDALDVLRETGVSEREAGDLLGRIEFTLRLEHAVGDSEMVLETVSEELGVKHEVFSRVAEAAPDGTVLASNTSSIPITRIAAGVPDHADRVVGCHWWYPPYLLDPVEVVRGEETSDETVERTRAFVESVGKDPILVERDVPGFVWNRVQFAVVRECLHLVEEGVASAADVNRAVRDGYARRTSVIGPLETMDLAGLDLFRTIAADLYPELSSRAEPNPVLDERLDEGRTGVESGAGIFEYDRSIETVARERDERLAALARVHSGFGSDEEEP
jgi:3-hydroxybutyryl-CoA dehydrogenase